MSLIEVVLGGVITGGLYALIAIGFNLQYGVARIFNLAYGEFLMAAAFAAFWMFTLAHIDPILGMALSVPVTFGANWLVYRVLMLPLVRRARTRDDLEGDTILATFGLLFVLKGAAQLAFTPDNRFYNYLNTPVQIVGFTFAANRVLAFGIACAVGLALWLFLTRTRWARPCARLRSIQRARASSASTPPPCRPWRSRPAARWWRWLAPSSARSSPSIPPSASSSP
jgi:branched-chain amino acid transport system permease protein